MEANTNTAVLQDGPAFTIAQFCAHYGFSRQHYYELKRLGIAPDEVKLGRSVRILHRARLEWEAAMLRASNPMPVEAEPAAPIHRGRGKAAREAQARA